LDMDNRKVREKNKYHLILYIFLEREAYN